MALFAIQVALEGSMKSVGVELGEALDEESVASFYLRHIDSQLLARLAGTKRRITCREKLRSRAKLHDRYIFKFTLREGNHWDHFIAVVKPVEFDLWGISKEAVTAV